MTNLTPLEIKLVNAMRNNEYNDAIESPTWSFTAIDNSGMSGKTARGVISSLVQKGLVVVEVEKGENDTISFTKEGVKLFDEADGEACDWGGKPLLKETERAVAEDKEIIKQATKVVKAAKATKAKEITVAAFTGMVIGTFAVTSETKEEIACATTKGVTLTFNKKTGIQTNAKNPKFANKIVK